MQRSSFPAPTQIRGPSSKSKLACQRCRDRHVKCDQQRPCGSCQRQNANCDYGTHHLFTALEWKPGVELDSPTWPTAFLACPIDTSSDFIDETPDIIGPYLIVQDTVDGTPESSPSRKSSTTTPLRSPRSVSRRGNRLQTRSSSAESTVDHASRIGPKKGRKGLCSPKSALTNPTEAFPLNQYATVIGPWFDIFDTTHFEFSTKVPLLALNNQLLRLACLAAASKQHSLVTELGRSESLALYNDGLQALYAALGDDQAKKDPATFASCLLIAFCEMMQSNAADWLLHLKGIRDLVLFNGWNGSTGGLSEACFWIFCRLIILACLSSGQPIPLDISSPLDRHQFQPPTWIFDSWANKTVHLLAKAHNFQCGTRAIYTDAELAQWTEEWRKIKRELVEHEEARPSICHPIAVLPPQPSELQPFEEVRYLNGSVAGAMQFLDTASLIHVLSLPCHQAHRRIYFSRPEVAAAALRYARNVISNSISNRNSTAWVTGVQLVSTSGRCLVDWKERHACLTILRDIQRETGRNTKEDMEILLKTWNWDSMGKANAWQNIKSNDRVHPADLGQQLYELWVGPHGGVESVRDTGENGSIGI